MQDTPREGALLFSTKLSVATHMLVVIATAASPPGPTSAEIAASVRTHPVVIRRLMLGLNRAGLTRTSRGQGGTRLIRKSGEITLLDVFRAVERGSGIPTHSLGEGSSPRDQRIMQTINEQFAVTAAALEDSLASVTLADLLHQFAA